MKKSDLKLNCTPKDIIQEEILYELFVRKKIFEGLQACKENRVVSDKEARKRLGIK